MADDRRERLEAAGRWLRRERHARGYETAGALARALGVDPSRISQYERGVSAVPDERAADIARLFGQDEVEVRRHLALWVPEPEERDEEATGERIPVVVALPDGSELTYAVSYDELERMSPDDRRRLALEVTQAVLRLEAEEGGTRVT